MKVNEYAFKGKDDACSSCGKKNKEWGLIAPCSFC
jgi:hypothetical protein